MLVVALLLIGASCNKPLPNYSHQVFDYTVSGISDVTIPSNDYIFFNPEIKLVSGNPVNQPITVTYKGLPTNVFADKDNYTFRANYRLYDSIAARNAVQGTYTVQAVFSSQQTTTKTINFNLTIGPPTNRVAKLAGVYYPESTCGNYIYLSCGIIGVPGNPDMIMLIDRKATNPSTYGKFDTTYGYVDCCTMSFVIPSQQVQGVTVSGSGTYYGMDNPYMKVFLSRTFITDTSNYNCDVVLY